MTDDLTLTFTVDRTPEEVFDAINDVRRWWAGSFVGETTPVGADWVYVTADIHFTKFRTTVLTPGVRVEWLVLDSYLSFTQDKYEWTGTTVRFDIATLDGSERRTQVSFTHVGLDDTVECYGVCRTAWRQYVVGRLQDVINAGPRPAEPFGDRVPLDVVLRRGARISESS